jgi:hypothetical protein
MTLLVHLEYWRLEWHVRLVSSADVVPTAMGVATAKSGDVKIA